MLNAYICWDLFSVEYLAHMGTVDGPFIGLARWVSLHWGDLSWFPLWHLGMPFVNAYPPLVAYVVAFVAAISGMSVAHAFHWVSALAYSLGPVALFALALRITGSRSAAFAAGLMYSLVSWSAWMIPPIAADLGSRVYPRRLQALVQYGEVPHIVSMTLVPVAMLLWDLAIERRRATYVLIAVLGLAATVLTSWLGGFALAMMIAAHLVSRGPNRQDLQLAAMIAIAAFCIAIPWAPPSTIAATQFNSKTLGGDFRKTYLVFPVWAVVTATALAGLKFLLYKSDRALQFAILFTFLIASIVLPFAWFGIAVIPQPIRYHLELELAVSLLAAILIARWRWAPVAVAAISLALLYPAIQFSRKLIRPIDITQTAEWKIAQWLNREWTGGRVMMSGSVAFWLTAFSDVPQLNGGTEQGAIDYMARIAAYGIYFGRNGEAAVEWLKALGIAAVGVSDTTSGEFYKPYADPHQFDKLLDPIYRDHGDTIYRVGFGSLAHVIPRSALVTRTPEHGLDVDPLRRYVAALDDSSADFRWTSLHSARISASIREGEFLSVQIPWHKGWHANAPIKKDAIGFMYFDSLPTGRANIELTYDGGTEMRIARTLSAITFVTLIVLSIRRR